MKNWYSTNSTCVPFHSCDPVSQLSATINTAAAYEQCDYLSRLNYKLVNQINQSETQKYFYRNRLNQQHKTHTTQLEQAFKIINQRNSLIMQLQESIQKGLKQYRILQTDYNCLKSNSDAEKEYFRKEIENIESKCRDKIKNMEIVLQKQYQLKLSRRIQQITKQCQSRIKTFQSQITTLTQTTNQLTHQLKLSQDSYREMLLKKDTLVQESINRELRKRDYEAQNNYLRDVSQYEAMIKEKAEMKTEMAGLDDRYRVLKGRVGELEAELQTEKTKNNILNQTLKTCQQQNQKLQEQVNQVSLQKQSSQRTLNKQDLSLNNRRNTTDADTVVNNRNTYNPNQPNFVPIITPADMDLVSEIVSLKEFVVQKIVQRFLELFVKSSTTDPKKKSFSLTTFKSSLQLLKQANPQNKILLHIQSQLDRIIRIYCPAMTYSRQYLTVKDQFIKRTLMQCETIASPAQKLYRTLELVNRLKNPVTHVTQEISAGELRMVQLKILQALRKVLAH